ncbi:MAG: 4Fe-4S binding protein [Nitrospirota bacterium]
MWIVTIDADKCTGEGKCYEICPVSVFGEPKDGKCQIVNADLCEGCESCLAECPTEAITLKEM